MPDLTDEIDVYTAVDQALRASARRDEISMAKATNIRQKERLRRPLHTYTPDELEILIVIHWKTGVDAHGPDEDFTYEMLRLISTYEYRTGKTGGTVGSVFGFQQKHFGE